MDWITFYRGEHRRIVSFAEMNSLIGELRDHLAQMNVYAGDRVIVQMPNSVEAVAAYLALRNAGLVAVPVSVQDTDTQLQYAIAHSGARVMIRPDAVTMIPQIQNDLSIPQDLQTIIYTSGTTGQPKGVMLGKAQWNANARALVSHHGLTEYSVIGSPLPLSHVNAHGFAMLTSSKAACRYVLFDRSSPAMLDAVNREGVTILSLVPALLYTLLRQYPDWKPHADFRYIVSAASPLPASTWQGVRKQWGCRINQGYGLSESTNFSCTMPPDLDDATYVSIMQPFPSIGIALPGVTIVVGDHDLEGQSGEIRIKSPSNFMGYLGHPVTDHTWVDSGDLGYYRIVNGQRFYYISGRIKEQINRGGESLSPVALEEELRFLGLTGDFAVVSMPDERLGEEIGLVHTESFDTTLLARSAYARRPKVTRLVEAIPRTATGKVQRKEAAKLLC